MLQSPILRRLYNNLQQVTAPDTEDAPQNFSPGIMEQYISNRNANVPHKNYPPPPPIPLPAFREPVAQEASAPQPTMKDPQPAPPPIDIKPPGEETKIEDKPVRERTPSVINTGVDENFAKGPAEGWMQQQLGNSAGGYNNFTTGINSVNSNTGRGGYFSNSGTRYS